ncbi:MAG: ATP synthase epsilon chain [Parcubacteria group bacterium GW2011_GWA2_43_17]|nr:MAG: ATP synthase epsilon chain [Parcubacteria group bacterium GW2011_GWA2_43_17]KKT89945.1 MAG: ATP synthase epsilon chain [Parcubacteria group bacterium GW2011_GWF2_45_11]
MKVSILEPRGIIWEGMSRQVILPAADGQMSVLDFHQPFFVRLKSGQIKAGGMETNIKEGIAFMRANELKIVVET